MSSNNNKNDNEHAISLRTAGMSSLNLMATQESGSSSPNASIAAVSRHLPSSSTNGGNATMVDNRRMENLLENFYKHAGSDPAQPAALIRLVFKPEHDCFKKFILSKSPLTIGRDTHCDLQIASIEISRSHAQVIFKNNRWWIVDLNSTNGVFVDGIKVNKISQLIDKSLVSFGPLCNTGFRYLFVYNFEQYIMFQNRLSMKTPPHSFDEPDMAPMDVPMRKLSPANETVSLLPEVGVDSRMIQVEKLEEEIRKYKEESHKLDQQIKIVQSEYEIMKKKIADLVTESEQLNEATEMMKRYRNHRMLALDNPNVEMWKKAVLNELTCTICCEIMVEPVTLNCRHTFCHYCIESWKSRSPLSYHMCPLCRKTIRGNTQSLLFDSLMDLFLKQVSTEAEMDERKNLIETRKRQLSELAQRETNAGERWAFNNLFGESLVLAGPDSLSPVPSEQDFSDSDDDDSESYDEDDENNDGDDDYRDYNRDYTGQDTELDAHRLELNLFRDIRRLIRLEGISFGPWAANSSEENQANNALDSISVQDISMDSAADAHQQLEGIGLNSSENENNFQTDSLWDMSRSSQPESNNRRPLRRSRRLNPAAQNRTHATVVRDHPYQLRSRGSLQQQQQQRRERNHSSASLRNDSSEV